LIVKILLSYCRSKLFPVKPIRSFKDWVTNKFGGKLYELFFESYTKKIWGMPCENISAEWAAQRIKGLSIKTTLFGAIFRNNKKNNTKTLINKFKYPKYGPGMMYNSIAKRSEMNGVKIKTNTKIENLDYRNHKWFARIKGGRIDREEEYDEVISTMPITKLVKILSPSAPQKILEISSNYKYRDFICCCLVFNFPPRLKDNWLYINNNNVRMARVQIVNNWSKYMLRNKNYSSFTVEYFCSYKDDLWEKQDNEMVKLAVQELLTIGLINSQEKLLQGNIVRVRNAYPVYDNFYQNSINILVDYIKRVPGLQVAGRGGMFKYNNMDHSIYTGLLAARNIIAGYKKYDLWKVNQDEEYGES